MFFEKKISCLTEKQEKYVLEDKNFNIFGMDIDFLWRNTGKCY